MTRLIILAALIALVSTLYSSAHTKTVYHRESIYDCLIRTSTGTYVPCDDVPGYWRDA